MVIESRSKLPNLRGNFKQIQTCFINQSTIFIKKIDALILCSFVAMITAQKAAATIEIVHSSLTGLDRIPYRVGVIGKKC